MTAQQKFGTSNLDDELKRVIENCQSIVNDNRTVVKLESLKSLEKSQPQDVTLEKVVRDMTQVLFDLKNGIKLVKSSPKTDSTFNVQDELEKLYKKQDEEKRKKEEEEAKKAAEKSPNSQPQKRTNTAKKQGVKKEANKNDQNKINTSAQKPKKVLPKTSPSKANQDKITVSNVKFPLENKKIVNAISSSRNTEQRRPNSCPQPTLRKPSPNISVKKTMSIPPSREIYNPLGIIRDEVDKAKRENKTFTIKGNFPAVRRALLKRGWVEKFHPGYREKLNDDIKRFQQMDVTDLVDLLRNKEIAQSIKKLIKSKLLRDHQVDLYWDHNFDAFKECPDSKKLTLINRFRRESFSYTSKQGLCQAAKEAYWLQIPGVAKINHPRCYVLTKGGDTKSFLKDFGLTAAISLLKWIVKNNITGECKIVSGSGKIPIKTFDFAITECYKFIKREKHQDIDEEIRDALELEWNEYLDYFYKIVHIGNHFKLSDKSANPYEVTKDMVRKSNYLLNELREHIPCLDMDGYMNIWILKPTNSSRGEGIHICRTLQLILEIVRKNPNRRYVIQKYIERPLLIHDTKFDIRQWFLVSSSYPLTIWLYKLSYLRFSSQTYNLRKLHEAIHLTNNSVQAKYMKHSTRDPLLPSYGMWDSKQFKNYLSDIGFPDKFEVVIYPGMKQCITGAMIAHRDKIDKRKNCFEIYGADFMLSENFEPWLLEINSNPALHASTPVTAKMCPEVLEDVIKVVIDHARNPKASTGNFELIYVENLETQTANVKEKFEITGTPIPENYFCDIKFEENKITADSFKPDPGRILLQTGESMKNALRNLLAIVKKEKMKRRTRKEQSIEVYPLNNASSSTQTNKDVISIFQNTLSKVSSKHSERMFDSNCVTSEEELSADESKQIAEVLGEITSLQNKKKLLTSLVKVVDTLTNTSKKLQNKK